VLKNALFLPVTKADYRVIPWATFTDPELARVGLTEQQARERHGDNIYVVKQDFAEVDRAQAEALTSGFAKLSRDAMVRFLALIWLDQLRVNSRNRFGNVS